MSAYVKNVSRTILNNFRRYIVMVLITALGVAFFVGLRSTSPDMNYTLDTYFDEQGVYDLRLMTSLGITKEQADSIAASSAVESAYPAYYCDMFITLGSGSSLARIHSLELEEGGPSFINLPLLVEGRYPESADECLVSERFLSLKGGKLGDVVEVFTGDEEELSDTLSRGSYRIVGSVETPVYISPTLGPSGKGSGSLDTYMYIPSENFTSEVYTEVYIRLKGSGDYSRFSDEYEKLLEPVIDEFKRSGEVIAWERYEDVQSEGAEKIDDGRKEIADARSKLEDAEREITDANEKIDDGERELAEKEDEFVREIADAERELSDAEQLLEDAKKELADAKQELTDGQTSLEDLKKGLRELADELGVRKIDSIPQKMQENLDEFFAAEAEIEDARIQLAEARREITENRSKLQDAEAELNANSGALLQARAYLSEIEASLVQVQSGKSGIIQGYGADLSLYPALVKAQWDGLVVSEQQLTAGISQIQQQLVEAEYAKIQIENGWSQLEAGEKTLEEGLKQWQEGNRLLEGQRHKLQKLADELEIASIEELPKGIRKLINKIPEAEKEIADGLEEIADAEKTLSEKMIEYYDGVRELEEGRAEGLEGIAEGREKISDARIELEDGRQKYEEAKTEADDKLPKAEQDIADAEKKLRDLGEPKSYVLDLNSNIGFASFSQDSERIDMISQFFPLIFFLVATLVSFTSMVRVIEHDRPVAGALYSLGYRPSAIIMKYVIFALAVCIPGCGVGILIGYQLFPALIFNQGYRILYLMPLLLTQLQLRFCVLAFVISLASVLTPTLIVCTSTLSDVPAVLLRPKPPQSGKRILLERVTFVWNRMSFSAKVTARNILRYKERFFMTVTGIAGCTAILLTGFGLRDSIGTIAEKQFGSVFLYDIDVELKDNPSEVDTEALENTMDGEQRVNGYIYCHKDSYDGGNGEITKDVTVCVPSDMEEFAHFVSLRDPKKGEALIPGDSGTVITQKLANLLSLGIGDEITFTDIDGNTFHSNITGVAENYVAHYAYMNAESYRNVFGAEADYNVILCFASDLDADSQTEVSSELLKNEAVNGVSFLSKSRDFYTDTISSLNFVVLVLLISGALLSFVVLFSLTGINIDERQRELATLKVLGFYERETASYIFRENIISTLIGTITGLPAGIALHRVVMSTAEIDMVMFGRQIHPLSYAATIALSFLFLAVVNRVMGFFNIRKIDMIESLKSVE